MNINGATSDMFLSIAGGQREATSRIASAEIYAKAILPIFTSLVFCPKFEFFVETVFQYSLWNYELPADELAERPLINRFAGP
jgi:hypothetical protein